LRDQGVPEEEKSEKTATATQIQEPLKITLERTTKSLNGEESKGMRSNRNSRGEGGEFTGKGKPPPKDLLHGPKDQPKKNPGKKETETKKTGPASSMKGGAGRGRNQV